MSHREQLAQFDAAVSQMRSRMQEGQHDCKAERFGDAFVLSIAPKIAAKEEPKIEAEPVAELDTDADTELETKAQG